MKKRTTAILITLTLAVSMMTGPVFADTSLLDDAAVYYTPANDYKSGDCILTASKMMIRRASILRGSKAWDKITNSSLRSPATYLGLLLNSFSIEADGLSYKVASGSFSGKGEAARIKEFENLLQSHPEGIVVHGTNAASSGTHGVLVTSVVNGVVYAADSSHNTGSQRKGIEKWSDTTMKKADSVSKYWYIKEVGLAKGVPEPAPGQPIKPLSADDADYPSTLSISGASIPTDIKQGKTFAVKGVVNSNYRIKKVIVGIYSASGSEMSAKSAEPDKWSYDISKLDKYIKFGKLPAGSYIYRVAASDEKDSVTLIDSAFSVKGVSKLRIVSYNKPKTIKKGKGFSIKGLVKSNKKIKNVTVQIKDVNGSVLYSATAKPNKKSYNISKMKKKLKFKKLAKGKYYYIVTAGDSLNTKTLINKKFKKK